MKVTLEQQYRAIKIRAGKNCCGKVSLLHLKMHLPQCFCDSRAFRINRSQRQTLPEKICRVFFLPSRKLGAAAIHPRAAERFAVEESVRAGTVPLVEFKAAIHLVASAPGVIIKRTQILGCSTIGKECDQATTVSAAFDEFALIDRTVVTISTIAMPFAVRPLPFI